MMVLLAPAAPARIAIEGKGKGKDLHRRKASSVCMASVKRTNPGHEKDQHPRLVRAVRAGSAMGLTLTLVGTGQALAEVDEGTGGSILSRIDFSDPTQVLGYAVIVSFFGFPEVIGLQILKKQEKEVRAQCDAAGIRHDDIVDGNSGAALQKMRKRLRAKGM